MKLYISGPITGIPYDNKPAFRTAEHRMKDAAGTLQLGDGFDIINPHDIGPQSGYADSLTWADYLRKDLIAILDGVTGIATLPNWQSSRGARLECHVASELDIPVGPVDFWVNLLKEL